MKSPIVRNLLILGLFALPRAIFSEVDDNGPFDDSDVNDAPDVFVKAEAVPVAAVERLRAETNGFPFDEVEIDLDHKVVQYTVEWEQDGRSFETTVGPEGDLVKRDEHVVVAELPQAVRRTIKGFFPPAAKLEAEHSLRVSYEVQMENGSGRQRLEIDPAGQILQVEGLELAESEVDARTSFPHTADYVASRPVTSKELPDSVYNRVLSETNDKGTFKATQRETYIGSSSYEVEWETDGRAFEAAISGEGELLDRRQSLQLDELPSSVRDVIDSYLPGTAGREISIKVTSVYDVDADFTTPDYQLTVDPGGRVLGASGEPNRLASAPVVTLTGNDMVVRHQVLLGMPRPILEMSHDLSSESWNEVPMSASDGTTLEAWLPQDVGAFFRIRLESPLSRE